MTWYVALRLSCMGLSMSVFLKNDRLLIRPGLSPLFIVISSVGYALSGYSLLYYGFSWIDVGAFFPVLIFLLDNVIRLSQDGKIHINKYDYGYVIILALIIIMNIPQAFAVCMFMLFYVGGYIIIFRTGKEDAAKLSFKFALLSVLAVGISAVVFWPATHELSQSYRVAIADNQSISGYIDTLNDRGSESFKKYFMLKSLIVPVITEIICIVVRLVRKSSSRIDLFVIFINSVMIIQVFFETVNHIWHNGDMFCFR